MDDSVEDNVYTSLLEEKHFVDDATISNIDQRIDDFEAFASNGNIQKNTDNMLTFESFNELTNKSDLKEYSVMGQIVNCNNKTESLLDSESVKDLEFAGKSDETGIAEILGNHVSFQPVCAVSVVDITNVESESDRETDLPNLENINGTEVEMNLLQFPHNRSHFEEEATEKQHDQCNVSTSLLDIDKNDCRGKLPAAVDDYLDSCFVSFVDKEPDDSTSRSDATSLLLPSFEQIYDNDSETGSNLHESHACLPMDRLVISSFDENCDSDLNSSNIQACDDNFRRDRPVILSQIPNFEMLENNTYEASGNKRSLFEDKNVVELLKEIQNDLLSKNDNDDFGLAELFEESQPGAKYSTSGVKSKAAKKRKKQQQKLRKLVVSRKTENNRRNFAQSFQELQNSQVVFDDRDIDSSITCPVCLEMYHMPRTCNPCGHIFCDPCLRRLTGQGSEGIPCPLCRTVIYSCELNKDFEYLSLTHPDIYRARAMLERHTRFRHYQLPYTTPVPLGKRLMRQLVASRNSQSDTRWMSHDWFKFLLGCTAGMCLSLLIMLFNRVKSVRDARDVNIVFLSILIGASVTFLIFKFMKI